MKNELNEILELIEKGKTVRDLTLKNGVHENLDLSGLRANNLNLENMTLKNVALDRSNIRNSKIRKVIFETTTAHKSIMRLCEFEQISFEDADLFSITIENCVAQGSSFKRANFTNAHLTESNFSRSNFRGANLTNADAQLCNMRGVDFRESKLIKTIFRDADLRGADFSEATIESADFTGADLRGAIFDAEVEKALLGHPENSEPPAGLVNAVAPIVAKILKEAQIKGVVNGDHWNKELQQTLEKMGVTASAAHAIEGWDKQIDFWLGQVGNLDMAELLNSLHSDNEKAPAAVANMLEGMVNDLGLQQSASTAELFEALVAKLQKS
jgi:Uncharacterized low-complexity proteins